MPGKYLFPSIFAMAALLAACASKLENKVENPVAMSQPRVVLVTETARPEEFPSAPPATCPITVPQDPPFVPPPPYDHLGFDGEFWYGSSSLWTAVPVDGVWPSLPESPEGYTQKIFWWRDGYVSTEEPEPELVVTGERLDATAPPIRSSQATNAYAADIGSAMLTGVDFPTRGCWKITGKSGGTELSFVVWITP